MQRAIGAGRLRTKRVEKTTRIADLYQNANAKIRVPKQHHDHLDAVLINTAGGLTGGDRLCWTMDAGASTKTVVSTQACERIYRAKAGTADVQNNIDVQEGAHLFWLPQETILFDGAALDRKFNAQIASGGRLTALEIVVLGREAMHETLQSVSLSDKWRIHHGNRLLHADAIRLGSADLPKMKQSAHLKDHLVFGTLIDIEPSRTPLDQQQSRALSDRFAHRFTGCDKVQMGMSVFEQKTIVRFTARNSYQLRQQLPDLLNEIVLGLHLPTVWRL